MMTMQCCVEMQIGQGNELKLLYAVGIDSQMQHTINAATADGSSPLESRSKKLSTRGRECKMCLSRVCSVNHRLMLCRALSKRTALPTAVETAFSSRFQAPLILLGRAKGVASHRYQ
jgi:hypothetical protein